MHTSAEVAGGTLG